MDDQRIVFCLAAIHGMSLADIATVLELPLSQVRSLLDRASQNFTRHTQFEPTLSVQKLRSA
jgi:DNA-directed RNA polymerase specialized sigma24 family protein